MKLAAVKFKRKQAEVVSTYKIILCSGRSPSGCVSAIYSNGLGTQANSQKKNALTINNINANNIYLLKSYSIRRQEGYQRFIQFALTLRSLEERTWFHLILWLFLHCKINYISGTPQPFFELTQLAYLAKNDFLGRWGHRGAGLAPCLLSKLNWFRKTSNKCWRWYKPEQEHNQPFCMPTSH